MSSLELMAVQRLIRKMQDVGMEVGGEALRIEAICGEAGSHAAQEWERLHPDEFRGCCWGEVTKGLAGCLCWEPVFDVEQETPRPPTCPADIAPSLGGKCHDCAFRPDSPERADDVMAEELYDLAVTGTPFWCHQGMRRPAYWVHPDGSRVEGSTADWMPAKDDRGVPYQADGTPGMLCAGWAAIAAHHRAAGEAS